MKSRNLILAISLFFAANAFAGNAVLVSLNGSNQPGGHAAVSNITVDLDSYNSSSVTIDAQVSGRYTVASGGHGGSSARTTSTVSIGSPSLAGGTDTKVTASSATGSALFTKTGGQWFFGATPVNASIPVSASITFVKTGGGDVMVMSLTISVSWDDPVNSAPTIAWNATPGAVASGQSYTVSAHGHDADGNLTQVNVWKNGLPFAFAGGGDESDADSANAASDTGPQTVTFTAQATDGAGATSALITQTVTIAASPPVQYTLITTAGAGGSVSPGGTYPGGTGVTVAATPDATHDFAGWSGDVGGTADPIGIVMDRDKSVQASFVLKSFTLTTSAATGGSVTPGGSFPVGTTVTVGATPDSTHYFTGWTVDASGTNPSVAVLLDRAKSVVALFSAKAAQTINFAPPGDHVIGSPAFSLTATASSGLPVTFTVVSGPATVAGDMVQVTGPGTVTIQADQSGDAMTLAASPVTQSFNVTALAVLKYHAPARTLLQSRESAAAVPYVLQP